MKFNFKIQSFQTEAVDAVIRVFNGQQKQSNARFIIEKGQYENSNKNQINLEIEENDNTGYRNSEIKFTDKQLIENIHKIQKENNIKLSSVLNNELGKVSLDIEMETGTGKTYVYIKTMFELNKQYGWSKFIVVVPSIAIREGVNKTFEITQDHFMELYGIKARFFIYNSSNLYQLDEFSSGFGINVMIINVQAFAASLKEDGKSKESRIIYSKRDEFGSRRPIDVIKANRPIIILDEPQKMSGAVTQNALKTNFNPLFSLNYSATHKISHNLVYVLDALDAFNKKLVKKIEVKGFGLKNLRGTDKYLYLFEIVVDSKNPPRAKLDFEVKYKNGIKREVHILNQGDNLHLKSNGLDEYNNLFITEINPNQGTVSFSDGVTLTPGSATGNINELDIRRIQIRETVYSHIEKEEKLYSQGIKCLSLFFIDEVAKYRQYGDDGEELLGEYGKIFEEEYKSILKDKLTSFSNEYKNYLNNLDVKDIHKGYFSIDKQGHEANSEVKRGNEFSDDISAYNLILKNKERLLSFEEPARFIFSHSALREGWDNPNVFQICTLKHSESSVTKRQEVGRGLRLCVDQYGNRQDIDVCGETMVHDLNKLTVIASESYADFVFDLQKTIREDMYERPTKANFEYFTNKTIYYEENNTHTFSVNEAQAIYNYLVKNDYIDDSGVVTNEYYKAVESDQLAPLKDELSPFKEGIHKLVQAIYDPQVLNEMISNGHDLNYKENPFNENFHKKEFQELWNAINKRYAYKVEFDSSELIKKSCRALNKNLQVARLQYTITEGEQVGIEFEISRTETKTLDYTHGSSVKYDIIGKICEGTTLTRCSVSAILKGLNDNKLYMFRINPEEFIQKIIEEINRQKAAVVIEQITYQPSAEEPYTQDIFNMSKSSQEYKKAYHAKKSIQDFVFIDGLASDSIERKFAKDVDTADEVIVYAKLPRGPKGFYIPTPIGNYSPDWAIAFKKEKVKYIFFIAETKGTMDSLKLRPIESAKIECAKKLFNEISTTGVKYHDVDSYKTLIDIIQTL